MNPSQHWVKLVNQTAQKNQIPFDAACRLAAREHPDACRLMSAFGVTRQQVAFFNTRLENQAGGKAATEFANTAQGRRERLASLPSVKIVTMADRIAEAKQFANVGNAPVAAPALKALFRLPMTCSQAEFEAAWHGNGDTGTPINPGKIFAGLVEYLQKEKGFEYEAAISAAKAAYPALWQLVDTIAAQK